MFQVSVSEISNVPNLDFSTCELLVYIGKKSMYYAIVKENEIVGFEKYVIIEKAAINDIALLQQNYKAVKVAYGTNETTLIPISYASSNETVILNTLFGENDSTRIYKDVVNKHQLNVVYRTHDIPMFSNSNNGNYQAKFLQNYSNFEGYKLIVHCTDDFYVVTLFNNANLLLSKTYNITTNEKLVYQLVAICKLQNINLQDVKLELSGWISKNSALYYELSKYSTNVFIDNSLSTLTHQMDYESQYFKIFDNLYQTI